MDFYCCWSKHQYLTVFLSVWIHLYTKLYESRTRQQIKSQRGVSWTWWETPWKTEQVDFTILHTQNNWKITKALVMVSASEAKWSLFFYIQGLILNGHTSNCEIVQRLLFLFFILYGLKPRMDSVMKWKQSALRSWDTSAAAVFCPTSPFCSRGCYTSLCGRTSHSGTGQPLFVQTQACPALRLCVCVCLLADPCMPISGLCATSRKSQGKQNRTLCKQPMTNFGRRRPTLYLHYQLCSLWVSRFQCGKSARTQYCLCGLRQMIYVIA